jgi:hypothetical protein
MAARPTLPPGQLAVARERRVVAVEGEAETEAVRYGDAKSGVERVAWYADFVFVPSDALNSRLGTAKRIAYPCGHVLSSRQHAP